MEVEEKQLNDPEMILNEECEEMWGNVFETYSRIQSRKESCPPKGIGTGEDNNSVYVLKTILQAKEKKLSMELHAIDNQEIKVPSKELQPDINQLKQQLVKRASQLEETLLVIKTQKQHIENKLESEEEIFEQHLEIEQSIQQKLADMEMEKENHFSANRKIRELGTKTQRENLSELMKKLGTFIKEHFPLPTIEEIGGKQKQLHHGQRDVLNPAQTYMSLQQLIEELIKKLYDSPHDPYINIQHHWPPYIELLLRCGIALRHQCDCTLIKLESFQT